VTLGAAIALAGCTLAMPLDGLSGGSSDADAIDVGATVEGALEGSSQDAAQGGDAPTKDAGGSTGDAPGSDVTTADTSGGSDVVVRDSPATGFCASATHFFCADFDEGDPTLGWSLVTPGNAGYMTLDTNAYTSPPASVQMIGDPSATSALTKYLSPTVPAHVHVELEVIGCPPPSAGVVSLVNIGQDMSGNTGENVLRVLSDGTTEFIVDAYPGDGAEAYNKYVLPSGLSTSTWTHVIVDVELSETNGSVTVTFGGTQVLSATGIATSSANVVDTYVAIEARAFQVTASNTVHFDSVTVDLPP
jgi:hypothetical protein